MAIGNNWRIITMAEMTIGEAQAQLTQVNIAIQDIIMGKAINEIKFGSGEFSRWYKFQDVTLEQLQAYRRELMNIINSLTPDVRPIFRVNSCIPLVVRKGDL
jgi:hypothetical protein